MTPNVEMCEIYKNLFLLNKTIQFAHMEGHFELQNFEEAKKHFRAAARDKNKRIKKTANSWIKYAENEEIRVKNLALRRDFIQQSKSKSS